MRTLSRAKSMKMKIIFIIAVCVIAAQAENIQDPVVHLKNGYVRGKHFKGDVKEFEGFLGIPFAKPPVNELRLKDPEPLLEKWSETYNATEEKMFCMQKNYLIPNPTVAGVEDCLYLYVYRPKNAIKRNRELPVIVYIHGGGFFAGAAGPSFTGADFFMNTEDVIFVSVSYRLGPLGFLSTGDSNMSGNFGLKDQAMAIKWVSDNIAAFGGNSSEITLMGQSAGASSAHLHLMSSPKWSRNLIHKVVLLSGNGNGPYAYPIKHPLKQAKKFAKSIGIENFDSLSSSALAAELRSSSPVDLINACDSFKIWMNTDPMTVSRPVVEDCDDFDGFLCESPTESWRSGNYRHVPILTGFMDQDGGVRALSILENKTQFNDLNLRFDELLPKLMEIENPNNEMTRHHLKKIKDRYFNGQSKITNNNSIIRLYTERSFVAPLYNTLQQHAQRDQSIPAFVYKFAFPGSKSYSVFYTGNTKNYGPVHCDELIYLLKSPALFPVNFEKNSIESEFREKFVKFFTDFVVYGKLLPMNGRSVGKCEASTSKSTNGSLKCNYVEFAENLSINFGEIDYSIADFWNEIDHTMMKNQNPTIEVIKITKDNPNHQNF